MKIGERTARRRRRRRRRRRDRGGDKSKDRIAINAEAIVDIAL